MSSALVHRSKKLKMMSNKMWIDGTCFDIIPSRKKKNKTAKVESQMSSPPNDQQNLYKISENNTGKQVTSFKIPPAYLNKIFQSGFDVENFEEESEVCLNLHKSGEESKITITGDSYNCIAEARDELHGVLVDIRRKYPAIQFLAIPTLSDQIQSNFKKFKEDILNADQKVEGMDESLFQKPEKLHLTIAVMSLMSELEKNEAIKVLNDCKNDFIRPFLQTNPNRKIKLQGISTMQENQSKVFVLYAKAQFHDESGEDTLQNFVNGISNYFYERGFLKEKSDNVKIHVTLINTKYRKVDRQSPCRAYQKKTAFDASSIMNRYKDYVFGECDLNSVHLSLVTSLGEDGFYQNLSLVSCT